ncbi:MAG: hypothetical protein QOD09_3069 [Bradyrhizobium sp.]|jgi:hypothetical protein|nr:hypothetical protein [Bradyrhizobium sp.]
MSDDDKGFLSRWSQRKHEAKQPERGASAADAVLPAPAAESAPEPEFDLSSLPKLEDLTETTDITGFLRKGVPESLRNAALRQSWALDPAIRNYVNPALDYAYDWNTPGGVPGSGEIGPGVDIARMVSQIMGGGESVVERAAPAAGPGNDLSGAAEDSAVQEPAPDLPVQPVRMSSETSSQEPSAAEEDQRVDADQAKRFAERSAVAPQHEVRRHGSAKPRI